MSTPVTTLTAQPKLHEKPLRLAVKELTEAIKEKDAEIERLRKRIADLEHDSNLPRVEEVQGVYREAKLESEIDRLKAQLLDILNLKHKGLTGGEWILKSHKAEEEVERLKGELDEALAALKPFASVAPSSFYAFDGSENEGYEVIVAVDKHIDFGGRDLAAARAFLQKHTPPLNCGSAAAGESPSHSGGGVVFERYVISETGKMSVERPETGKSALREVPSDGKNHLSDHCSGGLHGQQPKGSTPSSPATLHQLIQHWEGKIRDLNDRIRITKGKDDNLNLAHACWTNALRELKQSMKREKGAGV